MKDIDEAFFRDPAAEVIAKGGEIYCAVVGVVVVGCVCVAPGADGSMMLMKFAVTARARGKGIGTQLCESAIRFARDQGARHLALWSNSELTPALRLYESLGFRHRPAPVTPPHGDADVYMERPLP